MAVNVKDCSCYDRLYYCKKELREILNMSTNSEGVATLFQVYEILVILAPQYMGPYRRFWSKCTRLS